MRAARSAVRDAESARRRAAEGVGERHVDGAACSGRQRRAAVAGLDKIGSAGGDTRNNQRQIADVREGYGLRRAWKSDEPNAESKTRRTKTGHRRATGSSQVDYLETTPGVVSDEQDVAHGPGSRRSERDVDRATCPGSELTSAIVDRGESAGRGSDARDHQRP